MDDATPASAPNPYPGLRPFRPDEKHLFFGREQQVDRMVERLAAHHFLAVVGGSGSGKSSLVNCGLRPALHRGNMAGAGPAWRMAQMRPGSDPIGALARALAVPGVLFDAPLTGALSTEALVESTLRLGSLGLIDIIEQADLPPGTQLLVVADQFEELFRFQSLGRGAATAGAAGAEDAAAFVCLLLEAAAQTAVPIHVVLTMRSDFLGDCARFPGLPEAINQGQYLVPRLSRSEIRAAITGPAAVAGAMLSPMLVTRLLNDVGDNPDQLSILQHALNRSWTHWHNRGAGQGTLDLVDYEAIGGMAHALDRHAERAYAELTDPRQQQICARLFRALTDKATDLRGVRRPSTLGQLCALIGASEAEVLAVIDVFRKPSRSFLVPPFGEPLGSDTVVDIAHESLMRVWQRLDAWADEEAQSAQTYRRLADTAALHAAGKASLWRDPDLQLALDWREHSQPNEAWGGRYHPAWAAAMDFLSASAQARDAEQAAAEAQRQRELAAQQDKAAVQARNSRRMGWLVLFSTAVALVAGFFMLRAQEAKRGADDAVAYMLFMSDQLKGLGKPYLLENLGRNLEASVQGKDDDLSKAIRARSWFLQGQAWLEQGTSGDYRAALRALLQFERYRDTASQERDQIGGIAGNRWVNELATAHAALGDALDLFLNVPQACQRLPVPEQDGCAQKWQATLKGLATLPNHNQLSEAVRRLIFAAPPDSAALRQRRDQEDQAARALFQQVFDQPGRKTISAVINLARMELALGDRALDDGPAAAPLALAAFGRASALVEAHRRLSERRMVHEQLLISTRIADMLRANPALAAPDTYREDYAFVADYLRATEGPSTDYVARLYADPVERFFGKKGWTVADIVKSKAEYFGNWPELHYDLIAAIQVENPENGVRVLSFPMQYSTHNKDRHATRTGQTTQVLKLRRQSDTAAWKITQDYQDAYKPE